MLLSSSLGFAKKKAEDAEITKLKAKIENVMSRPTGCILAYRCFGIAMPPMSSSMARRSQSLEGSVPPNLP